MKNLFVAVLEPLLINNAPIKIMWKILWKERY